MNKIKYFLIAGVAALGLSSCSSDFLNTEPTAETGTSAVFESTANVKLAINGCARVMMNQYLSTQGMNGEGTILNWYGTFTGNDAQKCNQTSWAALWNSTYHLRKSSVYLYYP